MTITPPLPNDFVFGCATSAYQIEGGYNDGGRGPSVWDTFCQRPGKIAGGANGDVACDTYHDFQTDIDIMAKLGLDAYRFSISWPRVMPNGRGPANEKGLDYYDRLVDGLLEAGITPFATLFHWDLPQALQGEMGGFANRECAHLFAVYAEVVARQLGDRVKNWITVNEPWVYAVLGHLRGIHAPGIINPWTYMKVSHHLLLGHGLAAERLKSLDSDCQVGISLNLSPIYPRTDDLPDREAADLADQFLNRMYLDSVLRGQYPAEFWQRLRLFHPRVLDGDMDTISYPLDFLGINYYRRTFVRHAWYVPLVQTLPAAFDPPSGPEVERQGAQYSQMGWECYPAGIFELLWRIKTEYDNIPVYITENGAAYADEVVDGRVHDELRQTYLQQHLTNVAAAHKAGADVQGYFAWSLLDNFEWAYGYTKRFGLVRVDFESQQRTVKDSGYWYRDFIGSVKAGV